MPERESNANVASPSCHWKTEPPPRTGERGSEPDSFEFKYSPAVSRFAKGDRMDGRRLRSPVARLCPGVASASGPATPNLNPRRLAWLNPLTRTLWLTVAVLG
eukprot:1631413-Rhodomonas_salina.4